MDGIELFHTRYPFPAFGAPAPLANVVRSLLESATQIAHHGRLLPWRLLGVAGEVRARPSFVMASSLSPPA
jgi:hypothetical protein